MSSRSPIFTPPEKPFVNLRMENRDARIVHRVGIKLPFSSIELFTTTNRKSVNSLAITWLINSLVISKPRQLTVTMPIIRFSLFSHAGFSIEGWLTTNVVQLPHQQPDAALPIR